MATNFTVVSFYTNDWEYPAHAERLKKECEDLGLPYLIEERPSTGDYIANTAIKPHYIKHCLDQLNAPVLWVDVDGSFVKFPHLINRLDSDFAACNYFNKEKLDRDWAVGILWFNNTDPARNLVQTWCDLAIKGTDEAAFDLAWKSCQHQLSVTTLPDRYHFVKWSWKQQIPDGTVFYNRLSASPDKLRRKYNKDVGSSAT